MIIHITFPRLFAVTFLCCLLFVYRFIIKWKQLKYLLHISCTNNCLEEITTIAWEENRNYWGIFHVSIINHYHLSITISIAPAYDDKMKSQLILYGNVWLMNLSRNYWTSYVYAWITYLNLFDLFCSPHVFTKN